MSRGFLTEISATGTSAITTRSSEVATGSRRRAWCLLAWMLAAFCWAGAAGLAFGQTVSGMGTQSSAAAVGSATPAAGDSMLYPGEDFKIGAGDLLSVKVFQQVDYQAIVRVDASGNVLLPFIGSVNVKGLTVRAAQILIAERLRVGQFYKNPEVILEVIDTVNGTAIITGEIHSVVPVATERSLREVLLVAGGLPATASHTIKIVRPGQEDPIVVDLGTDLASSKAASISVHPHDIIQVTRASLVYVLGAFTRQGAVPLDQATPLTLLQLVALNGGIGFEGQYSDLRLIRTVGTERQLVEVDVKKVREGKAPDPILQANDIIFLPTNPMKAILKSLGTGGVIGLVSVLIASRSL